MGCQGAKKGQEEMKKTIMTALSDAGHTTHKCSDWAGSFSGGSAGLVGQKIEATCA